MLIWVRDMWRISSLEREARDVRKHFAPDIQKAREAGNWNEWNAAVSGQEFEFATYEHEIDSIRSRRLVSTARSLALPIPQHSRSSVSWNHRMSLA
jgi:hypothetical protein